MDATSPPPIGGTPLQLNFTKASLTAAGSAQNDEILPLEKPVAQLIGVLRALAEHGPPGGRGVFGHGTEAEAAAGRAAGPRVEAERGGGVARQAGEDFVFAE